MSEKHQPDTAVSFLAQAECKVWPFHALLAKVWVCIERRNGVMKNAQKPKTVVITQ